MEHTSSLTIGHDLMVMYSIIGPLKGIQTHIQGKEVQSIRINHQEVLEVLQVDLVNHNHMAGLVILPKIGQEALGVLLVDLVNHNHLAGIVIVGMVNNQANIVIWVGSLLGSYF